MTDWMTKAQRGHVMRSVRSKDTGPELRLRRALHALGLRFRLHRKDLKGTPDIVLPRWRAAVFVNGCFWHGHEGCGRAKRPVDNADYWDAKIRGNIQRDVESVRALRRQGWRVRVVWECELKDEAKVAKSILRWLMRGSQD
jgi:DNA mismatch endonuclease (patch repair protein)